MVSVNNKINELMTQKRISAIDIEKTTGLNRNTIYSIISGTSKNPSAHTLQLIAKALDVSLDSIFIEEEEFKGELLSMEQMEIFSNATSATIEILIERNLNFPFTNLIDLIKEVYQYSLKKQSVDSTFINWMVDKYQKF
ncbi:helix-turn-helix transcriptional regulator [Candidatus Tisiphia endosymbiont of Beris chalybata]|uniref:helix-turn-helix domain-containing protein n=1 Tax=Candidatus Tisiphia endosymbiont of Beris chalybata TaxID=3066262 RepID=UPI00312CB0EA